MVHVPFRLLKNRIPAYGAPRQKGYGTIFRNENAPRASHLRRERCLWGLRRSVLLAVFEEPEEGEQCVVVAGLDGELSLVLGVGAEDPRRVETLAVDRVDLLRLVEQVVEVIDDRLVRDDGDLPVVEVVPHDQLESLGGVLEVEDRQLHGLGAVGTDDPDGVLDELDEVIGAPTDAACD